MPFLCASFCQGLCFRRSEARVAQPARAHHHTRVRVDIPNNVVRDIEYGQNSMSEIKTLAQKMDIGRYGKLGTLGSQNFRRLRRAKSGFHYREFFAIHIRSASRWCRLRTKSPTYGRTHILSDQTDEPHNQADSLTHEHDHARRHDPAGRRPQCRSREYFRRRARARVTDGSGSRPAPSRLLYFLEPDQRVIARRPNLPNLVHVRHWE